MLRLYYSADKFFEVGSFPLSLYMKLRITEQHDNITAAWQKTWSFTEISAEPGSYITFDELTSLSSRTQLYLNANNQRATNFYVRLRQDVLTADYINYYFEFYYKEIKIAEFQIYKDWITDDSKFCLMSAFSNSTQFENYTDADIWYFINSMFEFEQKIKSGGEYSVEQLGQVPLVFPFIPAHIKHDNLVFQSWEIAPTRALNLMPYICSAASVASNLLGKEIVQTSQMTTKSGTKFHPATVYDPEFWNSQTHQYDYENKETGDDAFTAYNTETSVYNNDVEAISTTFFGTQVTQQVHMRFPFVQVFDLYQPNFTTDFDMSQDLDLIGIKNSWIDRLVDSRSRGTSIFCVVQTRDYASLKNAALIHTTSFDSLQVQTGDYPNISCVAFMSLSRIYNNMNESFTQNSIVQIVALGSGTTNELTGNDIIEHFFNADETPDVPEIPEAPPVVSPDEGGGGTSEDENIGAGGSWKDTGDDTTVKADNLYTDKIAGVPEGIFGGLSNNTYVVHMNSAQLTKLMQTVWDENFIDYIYTKLGADIAAGVLNIKYGNINTKIKTPSLLTGIAGYKLTDAINCDTINQFERYSFGKIEVPKYFGSFLDYEPYTQITLYLPKVAAGIPIPANLVVDKTIEVFLTVDFVSGLGVYIIQNDDKTQIATAECVVLNDMPYAEREWSGSVSANETAISQSAQNISSRIETYSVDRTAEVSASAAESGGPVAAAAAVTAAKTAWSMTRDFTSTWTPGGAGKLGGLNVAILKISRPYVQYPSGYSDMYGYPSSQIGTIGNCKGYFEVDKIYPEFEIPADELQGLEQLLTSGVYA